jgi:SAM-dependent methyltransferase
VTMFTGCFQLIRKWFPGKVNPDQWRDKLAHFYATNQRYHEMTASSGKEDHPQVRLLLALAKERGYYAEVGCGGGVVSRLLGRHVTVRGFDVSPIAVEKANAAVTDEQVVFGCATGDKLPLASASVDGCYSFEVLEHIWDPEAVIREMVRVTKSGGFILISMPNYFSLDMHLAKRWSVRFFEIVLACGRLLIGWWSNATYWNIRPEIEGEVYPDCDMVTTLNPCKVEGLFKRMGCRINFIDSTYMCALRDKSNTTIKFQHNNACAFLKNFGDHWLILAEKL